MSELSINYSAEDQMAIRKELTRLFALNDRRMSDDKMMIFLEEILRCSFPIEAIIAGIQSLACVDLTKISYPIILRAIEDKIEKSPEEESADAHCKHCSGSGTIKMVMRGDYPYTTVFACKCSKGRGYLAGMRMQPWNGLSAQTVRGTVYDKWDIKKN